MNDLYFVQHYKLSTGDRIVVPKSDLNIIQHHAVYLGQDEYGRHYVAENLIGTGVKLNTVSDFFHRNPKVTRIEHCMASPNEQSQIVKRAIEKLGTSYKLFTYNCEHFANEVIQKKRGSTQVEVALGIALLILGIAIAFEN
ncbi:MAG TPA: lecithin retinol acyltransferase family protein [Bacteroidales bacterium]